MYRTIALSFTLILMLIGQVQAKNIEKISRAIEIQANKLLDDSRFSSVSIGVVKKGHSVTRHFGELTKEQGNIPTDETIYEIGSVSKTLTGLLTAYAVVEGRLSLDDNINMYINNKMNKLSTEESPLTIRQLLTHTSGLPRSYVELGLTSNALTKASFLDAANQYNANAQRGHYNYSGVGTELLSYTLEVVYKMPFDQLLQQVLFSRANMTNTKVNIEKEELKDFAFGYNDKGEIAKAYIDKEILWGGSGYIKTTMSDLVKYMNLQLQNNETAIAESHKKLFHVGGPDYLAYMWIASDDENLGTYYIHHGGLEGTQNWIMIFPKFDMAVSVVTNSSFPETADLIRAVGMNIVKNR